MISAAVTRLDTRRKRGVPPTAQERLSLPLYELRIRRRMGAQGEYELMQLPSPATPHLRREKRIAGLAGRNLSFVEHRVVRRLKFVGIQPTVSIPGEEQRFNLPEDEALRLGLLFRTLAPMRKREFMMACADGIEAMGHQEAAYWLGMAMHRRYPRRVLTALRYLLIDPKQC